MEVSCWLKAPAEHRAESKVCFFGYKSYPMSNWQYCCSSISQYNNSADLILFVTGENQPNDSYIAWAYAIGFDPANNRPILG